MWLWISFAVLTALVLVALLSPLRRRATDVAAERASFDLAVYRDQLAELERDQKAGLIPDSEAEAARNEVSRRILAAQDEMARGEKAERPVPAWMSMATVLAVPSIAMAGYLYVGRPDLPAQPLQSRIAQAVDTQDMAAMVRQVERHLETNPSDARGWTVLAPAYKRMGRFTDAANAYRKSMQLAGPTADTMSDLGETLVLANNGIVTTEAQGVFEAAQKAEPKHMKARFYIALGQQQEGNTKQAVALWNEMLADSPPDAPWREVIKQQMASIGDDLPKGPQLSQEQMQAGQEMNATDRTAMIRGMVDGLDERLGTDGKDLEAWLRLIRARMVLGEKDKALDALNRASEALKENPAATAALDETRKSLGL